MPPDKPEPPDKAQISGKPAAKTEQSDRLAAALRNNLKRRKAQARSRREPPAATVKGEPRRP